MNKGFFFVSRDLWEHPIVTAAPAAFHKLLIYILKELQYEEKEFDDHGTLYKIKPGQMMTTIRNLALHTGVSKSSVERFLIRLTNVKILGQTLGRKKIILTLLEPYIYKRKKNTAGTNFGTKMGQTWDKVGTERKKGRKKERKKEKYISREAFPFLKFGKFVELTQNDFDELCKQHTKTNVEKMIQRLNDYCINTLPEGYTDYAAALRLFFHNDEQNSKKTINNFTKSEIDRRRKDKNNNPLPPNNGVYFEA